MIRSDKFFRLELFLFFWFFLFFLFLFFLLLFSELLHFFFHYLISCFTIMRWFLLYQLFGFIITRPILYHPFIFFFFPIFSHKFLLLSILLLDVDSFCIILFWLYIFILDNFCLYLVVLSLARRQYRWQSNINVVLTWWGFHSRSFVIINYNNMAKII